MTMFWRLTVATLMLSVLTPALSWSQKEDKKDRAKAKAKLRGKKKEESPAEIKVKETAKTIFEKADTNNDDKLTNKTEANRALTGLNSIMASLYRAAGDVKSRRELTLDEDESKTIELAEFQDYAVALYQDLLQRAEKNKQQQEKKTQKLRGANKGARAVQNRIRKLNRAAMKRAAKG